MLGSTSFLREPTGVFLPLPRNAKTLGGGRL
jgi:hypothetical protein